MFMLLTTSHYCYKQLSTCCRQHQIASSANSCWTSNFLYRNISFHELWNSSFFFRNKLMRAHSSSLTWDINLSNSWTPEVFKIEVGAAISLFTLMSLNIVRNINTQVLHINKNINKIITCCCCFCCFGFRSFGFRSLEHYALYFWLLKKIDMLVFALLTLERVKHTNQ